MKITQLKKLIKNGETEQVKFKTSTGSLPSGIQTVCAFLNSDHGGSVVFGITDEGKIVGQQVTDKTRKEIAIELNKIEPHIKIMVDYIEAVSGRFVIVMTVEPGNTAPYTYDGRAYTRNQTTTSRMSKEEYIYIHNLHNPTSWEALTTNECIVKDLDRARIKEVVQMAIHKKRMPATVLTATVPDVLRKLKLIVDDDDKVTNAAVILFGKKEEKQFIQSTLQLGRFKGIEKKEFFDTKAFTANAFDLYDKAIEFLHFTVPVAARIEPGNPIRVEEPAIPDIVLREAVSNALVHRDYTNPGGSVSIAVYDDRVNISNTGSLPKGVTVEQLSREHRSVLRNPLIAHVFYICGKIEKWGRGTVDMIQECKAVGNPLPIFAEAGGGFSVTLPFKAPIRTVTIQRGGSVQKDTVHKKSTKKVPRLFSRPATAKR